MINVGSFFLVQLMSNEGLGSRAGPPVGAKNCSVRTDETNVYERLCLKKAMRGPFADGKGTGAGAAAWPNARARQLCDSW